MTSTRMKKIKSKKSFTLIELLIVVAIIAILLSILLPSFEQARAAAKFAVCKSNQSQHYRTLILALKNNNGRIPRINNLGNANNPETDRDLIKHDWYGANRKTFTMKNGTIELYTANTKFLLCPSLKPGVIASGIGSNGLFDQSIMASFSLAFIDTIDGTAHWGNPWYGSSVPTPLILDEDPVKGINGGNNEGGFCRTDKIDVRHMGTRRMGSYGAVDGSVHTYSDPGGPISLRRGGSFHVALPTGQYLNWLANPLWAYQGPDDSNVWHKRNGPGYGFSIIK